MPERPLRAATFEDLKKLAKKQRVAKMTWPDSQMVVVQYARTISPGRYECNFYEQSNRAKKTCMGSIILKAAEFDALQLADPKSKILDERAEPPMTHRGATTVGTLKQLNEKARRENFPHTLPDSIFGACEDGDFVAILSFGELMGDVYSCYVKLEGDGLLSITRKDHIPLEKAALPI